MASEPTAGSSNLSQLYFTAAASSGVPSVKVRPGRSSRVNVAPPSAVEKSAARSNVVSRVSVSLVINAPYSPLPTRL